MTSDDVDTLREVIQNEGKLMRAKLDELIAAVLREREVVRDLMDRPIKSRPSSVSR